MLVALVAAASVLLSVLWWVSQTVFVVTHLSPECLRFEWSVAAMSLFREVPSSLRVMS